MRKSIRMFLWAVVGSLTLMVAVLLSVLLYFAAVSPGTAAIDAPDAIAELSVVEVGGVEQTLLLRGRDRGAPLLLFVHAGPGMPSIPFSRSWLGPLEDRFVVAQWDQRGAGKLCPPDPSAVRPNPEDPPGVRFRVDDVVADTLGLAEHLHSRFPSQPLFLVGHSFGSAIALEAAAKRPDLFAAVVGVGQVVNEERSLAAARKWMEEEARRRGDAAASLELETMVYPHPDVDRFFAARGRVAAQGGEFADRRDMLEVLWPGLWAREYTLREKWNLLPCLLQTINFSLPEVQAVDLFTRVPALEIPVFFFQGRHDHVSDSSVVEAYAAALRAPRKEIVWFEESAHYVPFEEPARFVREIEARLLAPGAAR